ncbi:MAG: transglycosylase SLT domain-containing protein, partial [Duncaniella sp.]|nr:transglycosylase SLT domain-containing protein [Duncaniella sp.]
ATPAEYEQRLTKLPTVIELPYNSIVKSYIEMYLTKRRGLVADMLALHNYYGRFFEEELLKENMPIELEYLPVIESAINPNAVSRAGAVGLWQFMPATAKGLGMEINSLVDERRDPRISSRNAAKYLKQLYEIYNDWSLAIAAYNCGPGNVNKALRRAGVESGKESESKKDFWDIYNYLPSETRGYVPAFIAANYVMNYYREHGISPTIVKRHLTTDTVRIDKYVHFNQIAAVLNIPVEEIRMLNPHFLKDVIPGDFRPYNLTLPTQQCLSYIMSEKRILDYDKDLYARRTTAEPGGASSSQPVAVSDGGQANLANASRQTSNAEGNNEIASQATERVVKKTHVVTRGENIRDIAKMYAVSATDIKRWNKLRRGKVKEGD